MRKTVFWAAWMAAMGAAGCREYKYPGQESNAKMESVQERLKKYAVVPLTADLSGLSEKEKQILGLFIDAAQIVDSIYWTQTYGMGVEKLMEKASEDERKFIAINYGPWDVLDGNRPFIKGVGEKPKGALFYPLDMTKEEFEKADLPCKTDPYTYIVRDDAGKLVCLRYSDAHREQCTRISNLLGHAAELADDPGLKKFLEARAYAFYTDAYPYSDSIWLDMKNSNLDLVIGPIEHYEDELFNYKTAFEAFVLVKDQEWSKKLDKFKAFLPQLQENLPVPAAYKQEKPGTDSDLGAYDAVYYAGDCNSGSKTIAINLPNDEKIQLKKGTRRLQLKNVMRAKYEKILSPIADRLIVADQRPKINFDAFFSNVMFHEVAHGLGIKNTITGKGTVKNALKETYSPFEEAKADVLGAYMVTQLLDKEELPGDAESHYVTFVASVFRSVRFGSGSAHGKANMICFNFFREHGAVTREADGKYRVDPAKTREAIALLAEKILKLQGDGDYERAVQWLEKSAQIPPDLQKDLEGLKNAGVPVDIVFEQGKSVLGLKR
jgi:hypothetical protein